MMYSRHSIGFLASSKFSQIRLASILQVPHFVFILLMPNSLDFTPIISSHFSINGGIVFFSSTLYHSFRIFFLFFVGVFGFTYNSRVLCYFLFPPSSQSRHSRTHLRITLQHDFEYFVQSVQRCLIVDFE